LRWNFRSVWQAFLPFLPPLSLCVYFFSQHSIIMSIAQVLSGGIHEAQPTPINALFTCMACQVAFPTSERQRSHYRTE
jgi:hypothetical protein